MWDSFMGYGHHAEGEAKNVFAEGEDKRDKSARHLAQPVPLALLSCPKLMIETSCIVKPLSKRQGHLPERQFVSQCAAAISLRGKGRVA